MYFSLHYYVLLLSEKSSKLFEAFRDTLIEINNGGLSPESSVYPPTTVNPAQIEIHLEELYKEVYQLFVKFYKQDPLGLVLVGEKKSQTIFKSISAHNKETIREVEGKYDSTSLQDLGQIVWSNVKESLAGTHKEAFQKLDAAVRSHKVASGLEEVWQMANSGSDTILLVEEDYLVKGSIVRTNHSWIISEQVDIREVFDNVVDRVVEKVLEKNGIVIFLDSGLLAEHHKIALIRR